MSVRDGMDFSSGSMSTALTFAHCLPECGAEVWQRERRLAPLRPARGDKNGEAASKLSSPAPLPAHCRCAENSKGASGQRGRNSREGGPGAALIMIGLIISLRRLGTQLF